MPPERSTTGGLGPPASSSPGEARPPASSWRGEAGRLGRSSWSVVTSRLAEFTRHARPATSSRSRRGDLEVPVAAYTDVRPSRHPARLERECARHDTAPTEGVRCGSRAEQGRACMAQLAGRGLDGHAGHPAHVDPGRGQDPDGARAAGQPLVAGDAVRQPAWAHHVDDPVRRRCVRDRIRLPRSSARGPQQRRRNGRAHATADVGRRLLRRDDGRRHRDETVPTRCSSNCSPVACPFPVPAPSPTSRAFTRRPRRPGPRGRSRLRGRRVRAAVRSSSRPSVRWAASRFCGVPGFAISPTRSLLTLPSSLRRHFR